MEPAAANDHPAVERPRDWPARTVFAHPVRALAGTAVLSAALAAAAVVVISAGSGAPARAMSAAGAAINAIPGRAGAAGSGRTDLGQIWGTAFRGDAPSYEPLSRAEAQANAVPTGAQVLAGSDTIRFTGDSPTITIVANPPAGRHMAFRSAGLENPTIEVPRGATVTVRFVNADSDSAHGWLLLDPIVQVGRTFHGPRAFPGAYAPMLGDPTSQGQPVETIRFPAATSGTYRYECPVPGHAAMGMQGSFIVMA